MFANKFIKTVGLGLLLGLWSLNSQGSVIYYNAIDLADANPGKDLWRYEYQIVNADFSNNEGFDIYFRVSDGYLSGDLVVADWVPVDAAANDDWDAEAIQPELNLPSPHDGFLDGLKLVKNPSLQGYFYIDFIWRGQVTPGKQDYEFYAVNDRDEYIVSERKSRFSKKPAKKHGNYFSKFFQQSKKRFIF